MTLSDRPIHWSDWAQQPEIQIACTQKGYHPWTTDKTLPHDVHEVQQDAAPSILYTFNERKVTCEKCSDLKHFKESLERVREFDKRVEESGLTPDEYAKRMHKEFIRELKNEPVYLPTTKG